MAQLYTIAPDQPFVDALAAGLLVEAGDDPLALTDALVLLPNRRACRSLREAFLRRAEASALLLPRIQPIGEIDTDELVLDGGVDLDLPPAIDPLRRRLLLARLLQPIEGRLDHALRLAGELADLLDETQTERVALSAVERIAPEDLAEHWQKTRDILALLAEHWPRVLAEEGAIEPAEHRHRLLTALAGHWRASVPDRPIVAAGTTGTIPATRTLLEAILALPRGALVLPGLDLELDEASWEHLEPTHPQYALKQLLGALGHERGEVEPWPAPEVASSRPARIRLLGEALRPAATVSAWEHLPVVAPEALRGLSIEHHPDHAGEAAALALHMRAVLETPGRTAALVTPDRDLARRVAVELGRWGIEVDDSAGTPLDQTAPGAFLLLTAQLIRGVTPVPLLAVLKHPLARGGRDAASFRREARTLERLCLRGPRFVGGFDDLLAELDAARDESEDEGERERLARLHDWLRGIAGAAGPFLALGGRDPMPLATLVRAHLDLAEALAADRRGAAAELWAREAGEAARDLVAGLLDAAGDDYHVAPRAYPVLLGLLMAERTVRPRAPSHPRLFIWGQLEARLQHTDLLLLGGLNESTWPRAVDPGPWLNRVMREQLGMPPVERRIGQSAHDFAQSAAAPEVVLSRAAKDAQGQPTVPSRWLVRLDIVLDATGSRDGVDDGAAWRRWAAALDRVDVPRAVPQPAPAPPLHARPRRLSVSDVGLWMRDPYALYAKRVLRLRPLDPLEADAGALERGMIVHAALERFVAQTHNGLPDDPLETLLSIGRELFAAFEHRPQVKALWWPRFERIARWVADHERQRRREIAGIRAEVEGGLEIGGPGGAFWITARADRLEQRTDGRVTVVDYKTGEPPRDRDVRNGLQPQLPLEGAIVRAGGFGDLPPRDVAELLYWRLKGDAKGCAESAAAKDDPAGLIATALDGLSRLVAHYDHPETAYPARRPAPNARFKGDYVHLARAPEWPSPR